MSAALVRHDPSSVYLLRSTPRLSHSPAWVGSAPGPGKVVEQNQQLLHDAEFAALRSQQRLQLHACWAANVHFLLFLLPSPPIPALIPIHLIPICSGSAWSRFLQRGSPIRKANLFQRCRPRPCRPYVPLALPCPGLPLGVAVCPCWAVSRPDLNLNLGDPKLKLSRGSYLSPSRSTSLVWLANTRSKARAPSPVGY